MSQIKKVEGAYTNGVATAFFSINHQEAGEYDLRGSLSFRSVRTHRVLCSRCKGGKEGKPIRADIRFKSGTELGIKNKIVDAFESLYQQNADAIYSDAAGTRSDDLPLSLAIRVFGREFLVRETHAQEETTARRLREMGKIAVSFDKYPVSKIPLSALVSVKAQKGATADDVFQLLWRFVTYLQVIHKYFGENPFDKYYDRYQRRTPKSLEDVVEAANRAKSLPDKVFRALAEEISHAPTSDPKTTGMLLIHSGGISAVEACKLTWGQVIFDQICEGSCQLAIRNEENAGATHDYTHPIFPFAARELRRRFEQLPQDARLNNRKVLSGLFPKALVAHCRTRLHHLGMSDYELAEERGKGKIGGGVKLLHKDYYFRLGHHCGMRNEGELNFMRIRSLGTDVTADNYRSLSAPSGQKRLQKELKRDTRLEPMPPKRAPEICTQEGKTLVNVSPQDPARTTAVTIRIKLKKGQSVVVSSEEGLHGTVSEV